MNDKMDIKRYPGGLELHEERALDRISRAFVHKVDLNSKRKSPHHSGNSLAAALQAAGVSDMFPWKGYAGFRFAGKNNKGKDYEGEYDLVVITHHNILVIELKDWHGEVTSADGHWYQNGNERENAYIITQRKKFFLENRVNEIPKSKFSYLNNKKNRLRVEFYIVFTKDTNFSKLPDEERKHCLTIAEFLEISSEEGFKRHFTNFHSNAVGLNKDLEVFDQLFSDKQTRPKQLIKNGYFKQDLIFPSTLHLAKSSVYSEYIALDVRTKKQRALMRHWNFGNFDDLRLHTREARLKVVAHEHDVLGDIAQKDNDLYLSCMRPKTAPTIDDMSEEFYELFEMPADQERFNSFIDKLDHNHQSEESRLDLIETLINKFSKLHESNIAHRDIGSHSLWLNHGNKVTVSSFVTAYFQPVGTVGEIRPQLSMSEIVDHQTGDNENSRLTAYQQDVYALGIISHLIMTGLRVTPKTIDNAISAIYESEHWLYRVLQKAINSKWSDRFNTATDLLKAIQAARPLLKIDIEISSAELNDYRSEFNPYLELPPTETVVTENPSIQGYFSENNFVKLWNGVNPQDGDPSTIIKVHQFCELAATLKAKSLDFLPTIKKFGVSQITSQLYLVQERVWGLSFKEFVETEQQEATRIAFAQALVGSVTQLHKAGLSHGDIHPGNVLVVQKEKISLPVLIDFPDYYFGPSRSFNHAYSPPNVDSVPAEEADSWGVLCMVQELLRSEFVNNESFQVRNLIDAIETEFSEDNSFYSLERLQDAFEYVEEPNLTTLSVSYKNLGVSKTSILPDNGDIYFSVEPAKNKSEEVLVTVSGVGNALKFFYNPNSQQVSNILGVYEQDSILLKIKENAFCKTFLRIEISQTSINRTNDLAQYLSELDRFIPYCQNLLEKIPEEVNESVEATQLNDKSDSALEEKQKQDEANTQSLVIGVKRLWPVIIEAEMNIRPRVYVSSIGDWTDFGDKKRIGYSADNDFMDAWSSSDKVEAFRIVESAEYYVGDVEISETLSKRGHLRDALILRPARKFRLSQGDEMVLDSAANKASIKRRKSAVDNILQGGSVLPGLVDVFENATEEQLQHYAEKPSRTKIESFANELSIKLNDSQIDAIRKTIAFGPVSLVQGPPGTGKTHFIATIIAYLFENMGAKNILLTSQSHEAVNNAAEKVRSISNRLKSEIFLVRFSNKASNVSDSLQDVFSPNLISARVESFKAQYIPRIKSMSRMLGINSVAIEEIASFYQLFTKHKRLKKALALGANSDKNYVIEEQTDKSFEKLVEDRFGIVIEEDFLASVKNEFCIRYGLSEPEFLKIEDLIKVADDFVERLETSQETYETFLAKTRSLVCGTCVGLGRPNLEIQKTTYDWVIIDEAARSTASELAIAMQSAKRVILVGDHMQLPPLYDRELKKEIKKSLGLHSSQMLSDVMKSDFQRLFESKYGSLASTSLTEQYRMLPPIGAMIESAFYEKLSSKRTQELVQHSKFNLPRELESPVTWLDTSPLGRKAHHNEQQKSPSNEVEANQIIRILKELLSNDAYIEAINDKSPGIEPIGVICMYAGQRDLILRRASEIGLSEELEGKVKIDTVDSYQGKENPIVIVSLSLFSKELNPRFLREANRINVALSRAMERVVVVGATKMWRGANSVHPLGKVLSFIEQNCSSRDYQIIELASDEGK